MKTIGILKENTNDQRVCLLPDTIQKLIAGGNKVLFESHAGNGIGLFNMEYQRTGAITTSAEKIFEEADIICSISHQYNDEKLGNSPSFIGVFNPLFHKHELSKYPYPASLYSIDLLPRTTVAQQMDVLSSMASLAGYKAVLMAVNHYHDAVPMFTTAAGTIKPANVLILGAGVAGLQAIATAKRLGAIVAAFDVRSSAKEEVQSLGAQFIELAGSSESEEAGGYAVTQTEAYQLQQQQLIHEHAVKADIIICTANIPGKKAPLLIKENTVFQMKKGAVIVDLASEQGGNCELTVNDKTIKKNDVIVIGNSHLSQQVPFAASKLLSNNYFNYLQHFLEHPEGDLIAQTLVIKEGEIVHPKFNNETLLNS